MRGSIVVAAFLLVGPLMGCSNLSEKRAELQRTENDLHALTYETEQMRLKLPAVVKLDEDNKALRHQVMRLSLEVDGLRKKVAERDARAAEAARIRAQAKKAAQGRSAGVGAPRKSSAGKFTPTGPTSVQDNPPVRAANSQHPVSQ